MVVEAEEIPEVIATVTASIEETVEAPPPLREGVRPGRVAAAQALATTVRAATAPLPVPL